MRAGWPLGLVLALVAVTSAIVHLAPPLGEATGRARLDGVPWEVAGWTRAEDVSEAVLPVDPNEKASARLGYRRGGQVAWVSVALFTRQDLPEQRASLNTIYPEKSASRIDRLSLTAPLTGPGGEPLAVEAVVLERQERSSRLLVVYWHQLGPRVYASEYAYRFALMRDILFHRRAEMVLVRIALPIPAGERPEGVAASATDLAQALYRVAARTP